MAERPSRADLRETYRNQLVESIGGWTGTVITALPHVADVLPVKPTGNPVTPPANPNDPAIKADEAALNAFFNAGYTWDDAVKLAKAWHLSDPSDAKIMGGKKIEAHEALPFQPKAANVKAAKEQTAVIKFWDAGYKQKDAVKLAKIWHVSTYQAKVDGGKKLLAGETLPIKP